MQTMTKATLFFLLLPAAHVVSAAPARITEGALIAADGQTACPLKHTDVKAEISGALGRVTVTQEFTNPFQEKIEAVYTFPLPPDSAVDDMTLLIGDRTIRGEIKRREEARAIYDAARKAGHIAGLLDQERPNIFTQSVANIMPGANVKITISYVEMLPYEGGEYRFEFPMVVGPRYIPGQPAGSQGGG
ncbi:MAG: VIT domain-containing protein, partial [Bryobacteraceae bacterium]